MIEDAYRFCAFVLSAYVISTQQAEYLIAIPRILKLDNAEYYFASRLQVILCFLVMWGGI